MTERRERILKVRGLCKYFPVGSKRRGDVFKAVDDVSFDVERGQTLGIVGESGSGKTTCARAILRALTPTAGKVEFTDAGQTVDLATLPERRLKPLRRQMQMIFQDPFASLNPRMTVGDIIGEPLLIHRIGNRNERQERVVQMLRRVGLEDAHRNRYPHAFSGGQRQRIGIARALILGPSLVVADEAVSALDVSVRAQVLDLLRELQDELNLTYLFVSHDLSVVRQVCDAVLVMRRARIVEMGPTEQVWQNPQHRYTRSLLSAIPQPDPDLTFEPEDLSDVPEEQLAPLVYPEFHHSG
ncbi:MAG: ATP-binding cassette domain-containing protein [Planctomycetota bacterium]